MAEYFNIDQICKKNNFVLVDACSFIVSSGISSDGKSSIEERLRRTMNSNDNLSFWIDKISSYKNIYSTERVVKELREFRYNYKKSIKLPIVDKLNKESIKYLRRELADNKRNNFNLANLLELDNRIFKMHEDEKEIYNSLYENYSFFKDKFRLSEVDLDLLLLGAAISRENTASIVSNDHGIRASWKLFLRKEGSLGEKLHLYSNKDINSFIQEKLVYD